MGDKLILDLVFRAFALRRAFIETRVASPNVNKSSESRQGHGSGHILVIDHAVPAPDKSAGDRNIFDFMKTLRADGYDVTFWPFMPNENFSYQKDLEGLGVEVISGPHRASFSSFAKLSSGAFDAVILCRPHVARDYMHAAQVLSCPIVYYGHDLHYLRLEGEVLLTGNRRVATRAFFMKLLEKAIWKRVQVVTYPTEDEVNTIKSICPGVLAHQLQIFCFDEFIFRDVVPSGHNVLFVGSFGHAPNVDAVIWFVKEVMPIIRRSHPDVSLKIVGGNVPESIAGITDLNVDILGWVSDVELQDLYKKSKVVVVPLRFGAGLKLKVVEAMAKGVPLVTTGVGAQGISMSGLVIAGGAAEQFAAATVDILELPDRAWLDLSRLQTAFCQNNYSRRGMMEKLARALEMANSAFSKQRKIKSRV